MSNQKPSDLQSTREMLDELDALMEKMLALPINDPEDVAPFPREVVKTPTLTMLESPPPSAVAEPAEPKNLFASPLEPILAHPVVNPPHFKPAMLDLATTMSAPLPEPLTNEAAPPSVRPELDRLLSETAELPAELGTRWGYLPLVWINQAFDSAMALLGFGVFLRGEAGRLLLGVSGVALMLVAAGWFLKDWLGWN